jgi:hypothetical protein
MTVTTTIGGCNNQTPPSPCTNYTGRAVTFQQGSGGAAACITLANNFDFDAAGVPWGASWLYFVSEPDTPFDKFQWDNGQASLYNGGSYASQDLAGNNGVAVRQQLIGSELAATGYGIFGAAGAQPGDDSTSIVIYGCSPPPNAANCALDIPAPEFSLFTEFAGSGGAIPPQLSIAYWLQVGVVGSAAVTAMAENMPGFGVSGNTFNLATWNPALICYPSGNDPFTDVYP